MIEEVARVASVGDGTIQIVTQRQTSCGNCADQKVCSSSVLARLFSPHQIELTLSTHLDVKPGDRVIIGVPEAGFLTSTLMLYGLPILAMIIAAILGHWLASVMALHQELFSVVFGLMGLCAAFYVLTTTSFGRNQLHLTPTVLRKASHSP